MEPTHLNTNFWPMAIQMEQNVPKHTNVQKQFEVYSEETTSGVIGTQDFKTFWI